MAPGPLPPVPTLGTPQPSLLTPPPTYTPHAPSPPLSAAPGVTVIVRGQAPAEPPGANNAPAPPVSPGQPGRPAVPAAVPAGPAAAIAPGRSFFVRPRFGVDFQVRREKLRNGEDVYVIVGGVIVAVRGGSVSNQVDLEADRCVIFTHGKGDGNNLRQPQVVDENTKIQFYLAGNVEIREPDQTGGERVIRATEVYYDIDRDVAISLSAQLDMVQKGIAAPIVVRGDEVLRTGLNTYQVLRGDLSASSLPSDPGLKVVLPTATIEDKGTNKVNLFGQPLIDRATGAPIVEMETILIARNVMFELEDVPFFWTPYLKTNVRDPLGPIVAISAGYNAIYGFDADVTLNAYQLLGIQPVDGTNWRFMLDDLSLRGQGAGTSFDYSGKSFMGLGSEHYDGTLQTWGLEDHDQDNLGGPRPQYFNPNGWRGRFLYREGVYDLPDGFTVQSQASLVSDRNFMEAYYVDEWNNGPNLNDYIYVKQAQDFWAWDFMASGRINRPWITETQYLPRGDGYILGQTFFDMFTYNAHASLAFAQMRQSNDPGYMPVSPTDVNSNSGRADWIQDISLPFYVGPVKVVPYAEIDTAYYTNDLMGEAQGRVWGGGGFRTSIPFTRLFPDITSELFNVNGINHKIVLSSNYFWANTTASHYLFAQFDRLDDEAGDQAVRDTRLLYPSVFSTGKTTFLETSPLFDPQVYAMRALLDTNPDALDQMQVLQLDLNQRWQTKRGDPSAPHIIDWMTLDMSASIFPEKNQDNFGETFGFLQYDWTWNVGDRTALVSSGYFEPGDNAPKIFTAGMFFNRPDRTNFYIGYRQIEPLESRVVSAAISYIFSPKYQLTLSTAYDFGPTQAQTNSLIMTRTGSDLTVSVGLSYDSLQNVVGAVFQIVPNLAVNSHTGGLQSLAPGGFGH